MILAVDFDGTCVTHEYPRVGEDVGAESVLLEVVNNGHQIVLWTMRSEGRDDDTNPLADAVKWFSDRNIPLLGVNENPGQKSWTKSPKAYAHIYIDDAALGCPLNYDPNPSGRPFVDWGKVRSLLVGMGAIPAQIPPSEPQRRIAL